MQIGNKIATRTHIYYDFFKDKNVLVCLYPALYCHILIDDGITDFESISKRRATVFILQQYGFSGNLLKLVFLKNTKIVFIGTTYLDEKYLTAGVPHGSSES